MRQEVKDYVGKIIKQHKILEPVCEIGSFQVPGQEGFADLRNLFSGKKYIGCDYQLGTGVDRQENIHYLTFPDESIGTVLILDTLEHVANVYRAMDEAYRVLKPEGLIIVSSVMKFPIHTYPEDYWRFTPKAFELLLEKFEKYEVDYDGDESFPIGIYGYGIKSKYKKNEVKYVEKINLRDKNNSLTKIITLIGKNKIVLEFGCSTGYMSRVLKKNGCRVTGVDINPYAAKIAQRHCEKIIVGDIETINYEKMLGKSLFDAIVFADTLEHLKDPKSVLLKVRKFLKNEGKLILSIPNIAHASTRLELLTGDFEYEKTGILDESHLRFFTKKSIVRLLDSCGCYINHMDAVSKGLTKKTIQKFLSKIGINADSNIIKIFNQPEALAYQYIIVASTKKLTNYSPIGIASLPIKTINDSEKQILQLQEDIIQLQKDMKRIFNSRGWKMISLLHKLRMKIPILKNLNQMHN